MDGRTVNQSEGCSKGEPLRGRESSPSAGDEHKTPLPAH